jgi:hypothetical protein
MMIDLTQSKVLSANTNDHSRIKSRMRTTQTQEDAKLQSFGSRSATLTKNLTSQRSVEQQQS